MILFSDRRNAELMFESYCKETGVQNCPMNFIGWLQTTDNGKWLLLKLYANLIEGLVLYKQVKKDA